VQHFSFRVLERIAELQVKEALHDLAERPLLKSAGADTAGFRDCLGNYS